ncbi:transcription elongation factor GreA [Xenorhabdus stockiae]
MNVSSVVFQVVTAGYASYHELATVYGLEAAMNLIEIGQASEYNKRLKEEMEGKHP